MLARAVVGKRPSIGRTDPVSRAGAPKRIALLVPLAVSLLGFFYVLPFESKAYREPVYKRSDMIRAYAAVRRDPDLEGLWLPSIAGTDSPGYYHLHRDVPVYFFDQLKIRNITIDPKHSVSHTLCPVGYPEVPGFRTIARFGNLELRKQLELPAHYEQLYSTRDLLMPGIDGVLKSPVDRYL